MKYTSCLFFICFIACNLKAQITFNKIDDFPFLSSLATSIIQKDSSFFVAGPYTDDNFFFENIRGTYLQKINPNGEFEELSLFVDSTGVKTFENFTKSLTMDREGNFLMSGYSRQASKPIAPYIMKFNEEGKIFFQTFLPGFVGGDFNLDGDFVVLEDGKIIAATYCEWPGESTQICLFKLDGLRGEILWEKQIVDTDYRHFVGDMQIGPDGNVFLFGNKNQGHLEWHSATQAQVIEIDTAGNVLTNWVSNIQDSLYRSYSGLIEADGSMLVTTSKAIEYMTDFVILYDPTILKLDKDYNEVWRYEEIGKTDTLFSPVLSITKIIKDKLGNGYLFSGNAHRADEIDPDDYTDKFGSLSKMSQEGEIVWQRRYQFYDQIDSDQHIFTDFLQIDDGSFYICGEAINPILANNQNRQSSWFVRLDKHGCLVPGCHEPVGTKELVNQSQIKLSCYPNPSSAHVYVYINAEDKGELQLNSINGQNIEVYPINVADLSLSINVQYLPKGMYVFTFVSERGEVVSTKFFKE